MAANRDADYLIIPDGDASESGSINEVPFAEAASSPSRDRLPKATRRQAPLTLSNSGLGESVLTKSAVFIEDAAYYRSVHHKTDYKVLMIYRIYYSTFVQWILGFVIFTIHFLAFFEYPQSSFSPTADLMKPNKSQSPPVPCWILFVIELICLIVFFADALIKASFTSKRQDLFKQPWLLTYIGVTIFSLIISVVFFSTGCHGFLHLHRVVRPFFLVQHSSLMKKALKCLSRTIPQVISVLVLVVVYLFFFTLLAMCLFNDFSKEVQSIRNNSEPINKTVMASFDSWKESFKESNPETDTKYFAKFFPSVYDLLVLLTTANNPDVMMEAYNKHRLYAIFFIIFLFIGLFCFMNMLVAVFYSEFRGYLGTSMQTHLFRRRLGVLASYQVLFQNYSTHTGPETSCKCIVEDPNKPVVPLDHVLAMIDRIAIKKWQIKELKKTFCDKKSEVQSASKFMVSYSDFSKGFSILDCAKIREIPDIPIKSSTFGRKLQHIVFHHYFGMIGVFVCFVNAVYIAVELNISVEKNSAEDYDKAERYLMFGNNVFVIFYIVEQVLYVWSFGRRYYFFHWRYIFDFVLTLSLVLIDGVWITFTIINVYGKNANSTTHSLNDPNNTFVQIMQIVNLLIVLRMVRIFPHLKSMSTVWETFMDIFRNLKFFMGLLALQYYVFAVVGMHLFSGQTADSLLNSTRPQCQDFKKLSYNSLTFNDFAASLVVLWSLMVVNNWQVITAGFICVTSEWHKIYFIAWWLTSAVILMNIFTASILDLYTLHLQNNKNMSRTVELQPEPNPFNHTTRSRESQYFIDDFHQVFRSELTEPTFNELLKAYKLIHVSDVQAANKIKSSNLVT